MKKRPEVMVGANSSVAKHSSYRSRYSRVFFRLCLAIGIICIVFYTYVHMDRPKVMSPNNSQFNIRQLFHNVLQLGQKTSTQSPRERLLILLWNSFFGKNNWLPSTSNLMCPVEECDVTSDRLRFNESSAVIIHWRSINTNDLPVCPGANATANESCPLLVLFNKEAPPHSPKEAVKPINDRVHWTVTYRRDSDLFSPYGRIVPRDYPISSLDIKLNRSLVCWLVSNCHTPSHREAYVAELKRFIDVQVFGKCGSGSCPFESNLMCYKWLGKSCKFYLSFENSICRDYSTEKLYFAMMSDMVPIVLGGDDYSKHLPEHSFINVDEFSSPKYLAKYLLELANDDEKFLSYFNWKKKYYVQDASYMWLCDLCQKLHQTDVRDVKPHRDIIEWWFGESHCFSF